MHTGRALCYGPYARLSACARASGVTQGKAVRVTEALPVERGCGKGLNLSEGRRRDGANAN
jgi:hypothetical protein